MLRKRVLDTLVLCERAMQYVNLALSGRGFDELSAGERAQMTALLYTTVENKIRYDYYISALSGRSSKDLDLYTLCLLRLGLCQILDMKNIPDFAAVNETVALARNRGERAFTNAILRRAAREKEGLPFPERERSPKRYLSVKYSIPQATVARFISIFGEEESEKIFKAFSESSELSVSVNTRVISREDFILKHKDKSAEAGSFSPFSVKFGASYPPKSLKGFDEGEFFVQNEASAIAVSAIGLRESDTVVDVCSAPGGKSFLAAIAAGEGAVYSYDLHESKISLIKDGAKRLGLSGIRAESRDAKAPNESLFGKADAVICDVPCSGLGVLGKKPDLRYKDISVSEELVPLQREILSQSVKYLKAGGVIVYSTCTLIPEENEGVTDDFIKNNPDFEYEPFAVGGLNAPSGKLTLLPHIHKTDGFYIAKIRKKQ